MKIDGMLEAGLGLGSVREVCPAPVGWSVGIARRYSSRAVIP